MRSAGVNAYEVILTQPKDKNPAGAKFKENNYGKDNY